MLVILDLDGTLIDSLKKHLKSFQLGIKKVLGVYKKDWNKLIISKFGIPRKEILTSLFPKLDHDKIVDITKYMQEIMLNKLSKEIKILPTAREFLERTYKRHTLALATSSTREFQQRMFKILKLDKYFKIIVTREDVIKAKPDPELLNKVIKIAKAKREDALYIGDSIHDYYCAKAAKIGFIGVLQRSIFQREFKRVKACTANNFDEILL